MDKFEGRDRTNVGVAVMVELNAKVVMKYVVGETCIEDGAQSIDGNNLRPNSDKSVGVWAVKVVSDEDPRGIVGPYGWRQSLHPCLLFWEVAVVASQQDCVLLMVERFPDELAKWAWWNRWWALQCKCFRGRGAGGVDSG
jgi:hypothetical protein